jgi:methyl-accepting chemotaxis protein
MTDDLASDHTGAARPATRDRLITGAALAVAAAGAALPSIAHAGLLEIGSLAGVLAAAAVLAWRSLRPAPERGVEAGGATAEPDPDDGSSEESLDRLTGLLAGLLPIWRHHLGAVRGQTETAINELVASFSSISEQFEKAGFKGASGAAAHHDADISLLTLCERELTPVIVSMTGMLDSKGALVASVRELAMVTAELQDMASGIGKIAAQTNMLALNAAIEAARAGPTGRGFAVIAKEIRDLSHVSAETGKQLNERIARVTRIMKTTVASSADAATDDRRVIELSGGVVQDVLDHVRELSAGAESMRSKGNVLRADVEDLLVSLQFQDRVSQILAAVDTDIERLDHVIDGSAELPETGEWLSDLHARYTTSEQRRVHAAPAGASRQAADAPAAVAEVDFF